TRRNPHHRPADLPRPENGLMRQPGAGAGDQHTATPCDLLAHAEGLVQGLAIKIASGGSHDSHGYPEEFCRVDRFKRFHWRRSLASFPAPRNEPLPRIRRRLTRPRAAHIMRTSFDFPMIWSSMTRWLAGRVVPAIALGAALSLAGCGSPQTFTLPDDPMVGKPSPYFTFHTVHKRAFPSTNFQGKSLVMVFIRPRQPELPSLLGELQKLHRNPAFSVGQLVVMSPESDPLAEPYWVGLENSLPIAL